MKQGNFIRLTDLSGRNWEIMVKKSASKVLKTLKLEGFEKEAARILNDVCSNGNVSDNYVYFYYGFYINFIYHDEDKDIWCCDLHNGDHSSGCSLDHRYYQLLRNFNVNIDDFKKGLYKGDYASLVRDVMRYKAKAEFYSWHPIFCIDKEIDKTPKVTRIDCFGNSTHSNLITLFNHMVKVFGWTHEVQCLISNYSIFGLAYFNAMEAFALRFHNADPIYATPSESIILDHFKKLLMRRQYSGEHIDVRIRKRYM